MIHIAKGNIASYCIYAASTGMLPDGNFDDLFGRTREKAVPLSRKMYLSLSLSLGLSLSFFVMSLTGEHPVGA